MSLHPYHGVLQQPPYERSASPSSESSHIQTQPLFSMPVPQFFAPSVQYEQLVPGHYPPPSPSVAHFTPFPMGSISLAPNSHPPSRSPSPGNIGKLREQRPLSVQSLSHEFVYLGVAVSDPAEPVSAHQMGKSRSGYEPWKDYNAVLRAMTVGAVDIKYLMNVLFKLNVSQMEALSDYFSSRRGMSLTEAVDDVCAGHLRQTLHGITLGPIWYDVDLAHQAITNFVKDEMLLIELILGRPLREISLLKTAYKRVHGVQLVDDIKAHISGSAQRMFNMALNAQKPTGDLYNKSNHNSVSQDVEALHLAAKAKHETPFFEIFINRPDEYIAAVISVFGARYKSLSKVIKKTFKGAVKDGLLFILHGVKPKRDQQGIWRDAKMLEKCMAGMGTKDYRLVYRLIRAHWDSQRFDAIKDAYYRRYDKLLESRVKGETSGLYKDALVAVIQRASHPPPYSHSQ